MSFFHWQSGVGQSGQRSETVSTLNERTKLEPHFMFFICLIITIEVVKQQQETVWISGTELWKGRKLTDDTDFRNMGDLNQTANNTAFWMNTGICMNRKHGISWNFGAVAKWISRHQQTGWRDRMQVGARTWRKHTPSQKLSRKTRHWHSHHQHHIEKWPNQTDTNNSVITSSGWPTMVYIKSNSEICVTTILLLCYFFVCTKNKLLVQ